ncbi:uncharacterized protein LOC105690438 [Athalia rosae]|uniref:uncharacterized protein LOC105690438 n=1 Tax=Athalia rosae TaxID=37344 RepID=UPI002033CFB5|nr:uncharacterized protein LOC105690438 [Athalia rosae]
MSTKRSAIAFMALVVRCVIANCEQTGVKQSGKVWDGLSAKWAQNPRDGFFVLPETYQDAKKEGWNEISGLKLSDQTTGLGYRNDPRVVLIFLTKSGDCIGIQIAFSVADMKKLNLPIDHADNPAITIKNLNGEDYYTATAYFHKNGNRRLWVQEKNGLVEIPTSPEEVVSKTTFLLKGCVPSMGLHYYKVDRNTNCSNIYPWALLRDNDNIVGMSFQVIGIANSGPERTWYENLPMGEVTCVIPDGPPCLAQGIERYGTLTFHFWFRKDPLLIRCCPQTPKSVNICDY